MLEVTGTVTNGVVVPSTPGSLPEGATVRIVVEAMDDSPWSGIPADFAEQLRCAQEDEPDLTPAEQMRVATWRAAMKRLDVIAKEKRKSGLW